MSSEGVEDVVLSDFAMSALAEFLRDQGVDKQVTSAAEAKGLLDGLFGREEDEDDSKEDVVTIKYDEYERGYYHDRVERERGDIITPLKTLRLALVQKHHSLWAEFVYNAARVIADKIDQDLIVCAGQACLELGAGAGLPGIMAAINGAAVSVISDYGTDVDRSLMQAIDINIESIASYKLPDSIVVSAPYVWGAPVDALVAPTSDGKFDIIFLADLIFNRSEHRKLLWTVRECLKPITGVAWVTFSHHDPQKRELDLNFFRLAVEEFQFTVEKVGEEKRKSYPFVEDDGLDDQRGYVYIYTLSISV